MRNKPLRNDYVNFFSLCLFHFYFLPEGKKKAAEDQTTILKYRKNYSVVSGRSCFPLSDYIWNMMFSSGYHILGETLINWGVSGRGEHDGRYLDTAT